MSVYLPQGFLFSACTAGIKTSGKPDLAAALAPEGASAAAVFTRNQVVAAPVTLGRQHLRDSRALDYLLTRPDWDGKTIVLTGGS